MAAKKPLVLDNVGDTQQIQTGDFVDVPFGGTGASTAAGARTALGLAIGSAVQAWGAGLDAVQALTTTGAVSRTGANTFATRTLAAPAYGIAVTNGDGVAGNPTLSLANDLGAIEALGGTGFSVRTATDTWAQRIMATQNRLTIANPDGVAGNPTWDLATVANGGGGTLQKFTQDTYGRVTNSSAVVMGDLTALLNTSYLGLGGGTLTGALTLSGLESQPQQAASIAYVNAFAQSQVNKGSCRLLSNVNVTVANPGTATFDATLAQVGDRIMLINQTAQAENGPWVFHGSGVAMTRPTDFDESVEIVSGSTFFITAGSNFNTSVISLISAGPYVIGTTALTFTQTNGLGDISTGNGTTKTGNVISAAIAARLAFTGGNIDLASGIVTATTGTKVTTDTYGRVVAIGNAVPSDIGAQPVSAELTGLAALLANGLVVRTAAGTYAPRVLTGPAAGLTITNGDGVAGNPTIALANDLAALAGLAGTGFPTRTGVDTWAQRAITGSGRIIVTNGDGVGGAPTLDLPNNVVAPGTYQSVTTDAYGRVIAGSTSIATGFYNGSLLLNNEVATTVAGSAVYTDGSGTFKKAVANANGTSRVRGLTFADINSSVQGIVVTSGEMALSTAQWDAVTGQTGGLTPGAPYFLDVTTAGHITTTAPSSGYIIKVGEAESPTKMVVMIGQRVQL